MKILTKCIVCFLVIATQSAASETNWPRWRGPGNNGTINSGNYPVTWAPEKVLWKIDVGGKGFSTPVVWDKRLYLTTGIKDRDTVLAFDWSGKQIWQKQLGTESAGNHTNGSGSNPSAVTDVSAVFVFFKSGNFAAFELDGAIRWKKNLFELYGKDNSFFSFGTSPVLTKKYVVIA